MLRTLICEPDHRFVEVEDPARISDLLTDLHRQIWIDIEAPSYADFAMLAEEFHFHPLALEDAHSRHQRPKVEQYEGFYFVVFYSLCAGAEARPMPPAGDYFAPTPDQRAPEPMPPPDPGRAGSRGASVVTETPWITFHELSMFMGANYLVTVHTDSVPELAEAERRWRRNMRAATGNGAYPSTGRKTGPAGAPPEDLPNHEAHYTVPMPEDITKIDDMGILLYSLLDSIVDNYFPVMDNIVERVESLEEQIFEHYNERALHSVFGLKKDLLALRRVLAPERDVLNVLTRRDLPIFHDSTLVYFQDIYDHVVRLTDSIDTYRDLLSSALDSYLSMQSNRLNITVQTLTSASIILMTLSLIAGIYGMNFANIPELQWQYGYFGVLGLMVGIAVLLFFFFRRKGWL